ncbi:hypothetical protein HK098_000125 [Nowakowskiella sp. JEL0407]|nr:hypothetical protein HK098_000125 [Nowakowskiella sp. JEL0407]
MLPKSWPKEIEFLSTNAIPERLLDSYPELFTPPFLPSFIINVRKPPIPPRSQKSILPIISPLVEIRKITDPNHPAYLQHGLFATRDLNPGELILEYRGIIYGDDWSTESDYILSFYKGFYNRPKSEKIDFKEGVQENDLAEDAVKNLIDISIDAEKAGNEGRFINDYRGTRILKPNVEFELFLDGDDKVKMGVFVIGRKSTTKKMKQSNFKNNRTEQKTGIKMGEELLVTYGKGFWLGRSDNADPNKYFE